MAVHLPKQLLSEIKRSLVSFFRGPGLSYINLGTLAHRLKLIAMDFVLKPSFLTGPLRHTERKIQMKRTVMHVLIAAILVLVSGDRILHAQATASAALQGTISDQSDAAIKGAKVAI